MQRVQVRLVSDDPVWLEERNRQLAPVDDIVVAARLPLSELGHQTAPSVLLVDGGEHVDDTLEGMSRQGRAGPATACVLALRPGADLQTIYPLAALAGARVVLPGGCELPELAEGIYKAASCIAPGQTAGTPSPSVATDRIITVFGTKGGVGKTTIAVNLGVALAMRGLRTALVDLHLDWGNAHIHSRVTAPRPLSELLAETARLDGDLLQSFMAQHDSGLYVLPAAPKPEMAEFISPTHIEAMLAVARDTFEAVVIDTPPGFPDTLQPALEMADHIVVVTTPEVPALRNARATLRILEMLQLARPKLHVVVNHAGRGGGVRRADVEATLGVPVWASLPVDDAAARRAANEGMPVVSLLPGSRLSRAIVDMSRMLVPEPGRRLARATAPTAAPTAPQDASSSPRAPRRLLRVRG